MEVPTVPHSLFTSAAAVVCLDGCPNISSQFVYQCCCRCVFRWMSQQSLTVFSTSAAAVVCLDGSLNISSQFVHQCCCRCVYRWMSQHVLIMFLLMLMDVSTCPHSFSSNAAAVVCLGGCHRNSYSCNDFAHESANCYPKHDRCNGASACANYADERNCSEFWSVIL